MRQAAQRHRQGRSGGHAIANRDEIRQPLKRRLPHRRRLRTLERHAGQLLSSDGDVVERQREALVERPIGAPALDPKCDRHLRHTRRERPGDRHSGTGDAGPLRSPLHERGARRCRRQLDDDRCWGERRLSWVDELEEVEHRQLIVLELDRKPSIGAEPQSSR